MNDAQLLFDVVINAQGQYSLWLAGKPMASGWSEAGMRGERQVCLDYINEHWIDMRPRSLREQSSVSFQ